MTYILIIILGTTVHVDPAITTVTVEFDSLHSCQQAASSVVSQINKQSFREVHSYGCYKK